MNVGSIELTYYWRVVIVFWATCFLSIAAYFLISFIFMDWPTAVEESFSNTVFVTALLGLLVTVAVMYFGSFVWWPLVVLWHWALARLRHKLGLVPSAIALTAGMAFVVPAIVVGFQIGFSPMSGFSARAPSLSYAAYSVIWAFGTALLAGGLTGIAFWNKWGQ